MQGTIRRLSPCSPCFLNGCLFPAVPQPSSQVAGCCGAVIWRRGVSVSGDALKGRPQGIGRRLRPPFLRDAGDHRVLKSLGLNITFAVTDSSKGFVHLSAPSVLHVSIKNQIKYSFIV